MFQNNGNNVPNNMNIISLDQGTVGPKRNSAYVDKYEMYEPVSDIINNNEQGNVYNKKYKNPLK